MQRQSVKFVSILFFLCLSLGRALSAPSTPAAALPYPTPVPRAQPVRTPKKKQLKGTVYFTLRSYIDAVVAQDSGLVSARLGILANNYGVKATRAEFLPHLTANADLGLVAGPQSIPVVGNTSRLGNIKTIGTGTYEVVGATMTAPVFQDGTFFGINTPPAENIRRAQGQILAAQAKLDQAEVIFQATYVYLEALTAAKQAELIRAQFGVIQKQTEIIEEEAKYNLVTAEDLAAAENKFRDAKSRVETSMTAAVDGFYRVAELVGIEDPRQVRIDTKYPTLTPLPDFDGIDMRMNSGHPVLEAQEGAINQAKATLALKQIQIWPSATLRATYRYGEDLSQIGQEQFVGILALSAPIFNFGQLHDAAKEADLNLQSQNEKLVKIHNDLRQTIFADYKNIQIAQLNVASNDAVVVDDQRTFDRLAELAKYGTVSIPALLQAELQLLFAKEGQEGLTFTLYIDYATLDHTTAGEWHWFR